MNADFATQLIGGNANAAFAALAALLTVVVALVAAMPLRAGSTRLFAIVAIAIPVLAFGLYRLVGTPAALDDARRHAPQTLPEAIAQLEAELQRDPRQVEGWRLLGRAYAEQRQAGKSRDAFARAAQLAPDDHDAQVDYAEARAKSAPQHRFDAAAVALLQRVLQAEPAHQRARWFLGIAQRQAGAHAQAAATWEPLLMQVDAATANRLRPQVDAARSAAGLPPLPAPAAAPAGAHAVLVQVALDPDFAARARLRGDSSVFVIARVPGGPPMPVAVQKHGIGELPLRVTLGDGDSPMPTLKLSALPEVEIFARLSASGDAGRQDGDIESKPVRVRLPARQPVELILGKAGQ